ncbi:hypothetical protein FRX31_027969 [Thalictrum thalictroides]|uniref:Uncharacterized protein n=1 Tax=Thalictrum thalictroides TaxID=46969 RepID=A0A7J6VBJ4_THATH|nr:hypothetical protein FRX31_027969 [Thalictrum thalictroides]
MQLTSSIRALEICLFPDLNIMFGCSLLLLPLRCVLLKREKFAEIIWRVMNDDGHLRFTEQLWNLFI